MLEQQYNESMAELPGIDVNNTNYVPQADVTHVNLKSTETQEIESHETFENQRHYPFIGWSTKLLPTDRSKWSSRNGKDARPKEAIQLKPGWQWLGDWQIDRSEKTDDDGWEFAIDFKFDFSSRKSAIDAVRRRRWTRNAIQIPIVQ